MPPHILILEDQAVLYQRLSKNLKREGYSVDKFTKSYEEGLLRLQERLPDIALLDIQLQGEKSGTQFGELLHQRYNIPFIYITDHDDNATFEEGLHSNHEQFIVKTKPRLDMDVVIKAIRTALYKQKQGKGNFMKDGVMGLTHYLADIKKMGNETISKVPINFEDIVLFTTGQYVDKNAKDPKDNPFKLNKDYLALTTIQEEVYFLNQSLVGLEPQLPPYFVRVSGNAIVNIKPDAFDGRINGAHLQVVGQKIKVTDKYRAEVERRIKKFYYS